MKNQIKPEYLPFAEKLREALKKKGLSQREAAEAIGVQQTAISFYCNGRSAPDNDKAINLEKILKMKAGTLVSLIPRGTPKQEIKDKDVPPPPRKIEEENGEAAKDAEKPTQKEMIGMPWCMPAQIMHMRKVLDQYEQAALDYYMDKYLKEDKEIRTTKRDCLSFAKQDFKVARQALADMEFQLRCLLNMVGI